MFRLKGIGVLVAVVASFGGPMSTTAHSAFLRQDHAPAPLAGATVYVLTGSRLPSGTCKYQYPELHVPRDTVRWEVRAIGIDPTFCRMEVEEGVPEETELAIPEPSLREVIAKDDIRQEALALASSVASGYTTAWYEDGAGIHVTQDTTYISWSYSGTCVSGGSSSGAWSWDSLFTLVSHGGTSAYNGCSYFKGDTWSTMKTISLPCPWTTVWTYYYHIRSYGWKDGSFSANHDDNWAQNGCVFPLWPHWGYAKTG
jgi:hypothetical protein